LIPRLCRSYFQNLPPSLLKVQDWDFSFARVLLRLMGEEYGLNDGADRIVNGDGNASKGATFFFTLPIDKD
jgi:hypothetical protein